MNWWNVPRLSILTGRGDGTFRPPVHYPANASYHVEAADFDGDGSIDLVVSDHGTNGQLQTVSFYFNTGDGAIRGSGRVSGSYGLAKRNPPAARRR